VRRRIIRAAAELYREHGYERAGMTAVAKRLGMTAPALYWYFRSKEEILVAFLEHTIRDLIQYVRSHVRSPRPKQRLEEFVQAYVLWQLQQQELSVAYERIYALGHLRNSLPPGQRQRIKALEYEFYRECRTVVAAVNPRRARDGSVAAMTFALIGMIEHLISWYKPSGRLSVEQLALLYSGLALELVRSKPAGTRRSRSGVA